MEITIETSHVLEEHPQGVFEIVVIFWWGPGRGGSVLYLELDLNLQF